MNRRAPAPFMLPSCSLSNNMLIILEFFLIHPMFRSFQIISTAVIPLLTAICACFSSYIAVIGNLVLYALLLLRLSSLWHETKFADLTAWFLKDKVIIFTWVMTVIEHHLSLNYISLRYLFD
jgi:hypothetical protein